MFKKRRRKTPENLTDSWDWRLGFWKGALGLAEQFAWSSTTSSEKVMYREFLYESLWHHKYSLHLRGRGADFRFGPCLLYCIFIFLDFGFLICQMGLIL